MQRGGWKAAVQETILWMRTSLAWVLAQRRALTVLAGLGALEWLVSAPQWWQAWQEDEVTRLLATPEGTKRFLYQTFFQPFSIAGLAVAILSIGGFWLVWRRRDLLLQRWQTLAGLWALGTVCFIALLTYSRWQDWRLMLGGPPSEVDQRLLLAGLALSKLAFPVLAFFWLWVARQWHEEQGPSDGVGVDVVLCSWVLTIVLALPGLASQGVNPSSSADFGGWYHRNLAGLLSALLHWVTLWLIVVAASRKVSLRRAWEEALVLPLTTLILPLVASRLVMGTVRIALNAPPPLLRLYTNLQADSPFLMLLRAGSPLLNGVLFTPLFMLWVPALLLTAYQRYRAGIDGATEATAENP